MYLSAVRMKRKKGILSQAAEIFGSPTLYIILKASGFFKEQPGFPIALELLA